MPADSGKEPGAGDLLDVVETSQDIGHRRLAARALAEQASRPAGLPTDLADRLREAYKNERDVQAAAMLLRARNALRLRQRLGRVPGGAGPAALSREELSQIRAELKGLKSARPEHSGSFDQHYQLESLIAYGGMARVMKARRKEDGREVAVKILDERYLKNDNVRKRFQREHRVLAGLCHPNLVRVFDYGAGDTLCYIVMEYLPLGDLDRLVAAGGLEPGRLLKILAAACRGLSAAHAAGVVHRDVKPGNILLAGEPTKPTPKLTDFGLAKELAVDGLTGSLTRMGTVEYCSPEQLAKAKNVGPASDIYSMGVTAYYALSGGRYPAEDYPPLQELDPAIPPQVDAVVEKCLARRPEDRWKDAEAVARALEEAAEMPPLLRQQPPGTDIL